MNLHFPRKVNEERALMMELNRQSTKENFEAYDKVICGMSNSFQKSDFLVHRNIWLLS